MRATNTILPVLPLEELCTVTCRRNEFAALISSKRVSSIMSYFVLVFATQNEKRDECSANIALRNLQQERTRSGTAARQSQQVARVGAVAKCRPNRLIKREAAFESSTTAVYYLIYRLVAGGNAVVCNVITKSIIKN